MGEQNVILPRSQKDIQNFTKLLLNDTQALEKMLFDQLFELKPIRIGAEQEFNLIDKHFKPACLNLEVLEKINDELFTTELARFNLECNIPPLEFKGTCLTDMEKTIKGLLSKVQSVAAEFDTDIIMTGILPTIRKSDVKLSNITPIPRYKALMEAILNLRGESSLPLNIRGIDELMMRHSSPMIEASNTGFQVHLQVTPDDFPLKYNIAQAIAGPAMAAATNSPLLFGKRLWKETRIALFQQSVDTRVTKDHLRDRNARVMFGNDWVRKSILEIYREDIMRFRILLSTTLGKDSLKVLEKGGIPDLKALQVHNSTVYRWNRPCYGVAGGKPHLRIENRVLPAGPTVLDEMANASLWLGLLNGMSSEYPDLIERMDFADAKANFLKVCRNGLDVTFTWLNGKKYNAADLMKNELIPLAKEGLKKQKINPKDINRYMDVLEGRIETRKTGSQWMLDSYSKLLKTTTKDEAILAITASTLKNQKTEEPVHKWPYATVSDLEGSEFSSITVESFMTTDLLTVQKKDIIDLAVEMMSNGRIRYIPVEDENGCLVGLLTSNRIIRYFSKKHIYKRKMVLVEDIMIKKPFTISPDETIENALKIMETKVIGSLPVVQGDQLVGIIMEQDFLKISSRLLNRLFAANKIIEKKK